MAKKKTTPAKVETIKHGQNWVPRLEFARIICARKLGGQPSPFE